MFNHRGIAETMADDKLHFLKNVKLLIAFEKICCGNCALSFLEVSKRDSLTFEVHLQPSK